MITDRAPAPAGTVSLAPESPHPRAAPAATTLPLRPRTRGRPSLYSEFTIDLLCDLIRCHGWSDSAAAVRAGLSAATLSRWKEAHEELALELSIAREEFRQSRLEIIHAATAAKGRPDWRAAAWELERIFPEDYARSASDRAAHQHRLERADRQRADAEREAQRQEGERVRWQRLQETLAGREARAQAFSETEAEGQSGSVAVGEFPSELRSELNVEPAPASPDLHLDSAAAASSSVAEAPSLDSAATSSSIESSSSTPPPPPPTSRKHSETPFQNLQKSPAAPAACPSPSHPDLHLLVTPDDIRAHPEFWLR